ncbi:WD40-repeat-containing domain protein [Haematococcus lacustris]
MFTDLTASLPSNMSISALEVEEAGFVAYVGDSEGSIQVVDTRAAAAKLPQGLNLNKRINTLSLEPGSQQLLAAACSSGSVAVWDVRRLNQAGQGMGAGGSSGRRGEPLCLVQHPNSCQSAYWAPDGSKRLLSTSFDNTLRVWAPAAPAPPAPPLAAATPDSPALSLTQAQVLPHDNQTGRWLVPFRAVWGPAADCVAVGSMSRGVDLFTPDCAYKVGSLAEGELMKSIVSRLAFHPHCHALAAANGSGRLHVWR